MSSLEKRLHQMKIGVDRVSQARDRASIPLKSTAAPTTLSTKDATPKTAPSFSHPSNRRRIEAWVMENVQRFAGFQVNESLQKKINHYLSGMDDESLVRLEREQNAVTRHPTRAFRAIIEALTVHETYFYRDRNQYDQLRQMVLPRILERKVAASGLKEIRVWSAGAATGEEPYTLAMLILLILMQKGHAKPTAEGEYLLAPDWRISILGTDISQSALDKAAAAVYARSEHLDSFRAFPEELERFIRPAGGSPNAGVYKRQAAIHPSVRQLVQFRHHNLIADREPAVNFDIVFCRNVLIYFDEEKTRKIQKLLHSGLREGGFLFLGPSDTLLWPHLFEAQRSQRSICFAKKKEEADATGRFSTTGG